DLQQEADTLFKEAQAKAEQANKNAALLAALVDVAVPREMRRYERTESGQVAVLAELSVDDQFTAAFRRWDSGLDVDRTAPEEVLRWVRSQPRDVREGVIAGLEAWMLHRRHSGAKAKEWQRLLQLANQLDANELRREVRGLLGSGQLQRERLVG